MKEDYKKIANALGNKNYAKISPVDSAKVRTKKPA